MSQIYVYTQHVTTIRLISSMCNNVTVLSQDRNRDPVEDILAQLPPAAIEQGATLYAVLPPDKAIELKSKAPKLKVILLQLDGSIVEKLTGKPYDPKREYDMEVIRQAIKAIEVKGGKVTYLGIDEFKQRLEGKTVGVFNDTLREALGRIINANFVKTCPGDCVEVNPLGAKSGYRISFIATAGRLTVEQMVEALLAGTARIYYLEVEAAEVPLQCQ